MASRGYFGYDPYDYYYYTNPYRYTFPNYLYHQPSPARNAGGFFPTAWDAGGFFPATGDIDWYYQPTPVRRAGGFFPAAGNVEPAAAWAAVRPESGSSRSASIPVRFVGSEPEPEVARLPVERAPSAEEAAVRLQAAARGFLVRRAVRALRAVEREAGEVAEVVAREAEALRGDARARIAVGEALMRLLLRLDAVRGAREYRRWVTRRVLALQDAVDALEPRPEPAAAAGEPASEAAADEVQVADESDMAPALPGAAEHSCETESKAPAEVAAEMEVDGERAAGGPCAADGANHGEDVSDNADAEGEWELVTEEPEPAAVAEASADPPRQEPVGEDRKTEEAGGCSHGGLDAKKLMEMVAALCERSGQQCAVIGALAERVNALERAVRRVEDAERRRRRAKKLTKEGKGSNHIKCYSD